MAISFLLDENMPARIWRAIQRHNHRGTDIVDAVRVGAFDDLPFGSNDRDVLVWADRIQYIP